MDEMCFEICSEVFYFGAQFDIPPYIAMFAVNLICPCDPFILSLKLPNIGVNLFGAIKYILYLKMYCICSWYIYLRNHLQDPFHFIKKENCPGVFSMYVYRELFIMEMFLHSREFSLVLDILFSFHNWGQRR